MRDFVPGEDVIIEAWKVNNYYPFACARTVEVRVTSEILPTTNPASGAWEDHIPSGRNGWRAQMNGVVVLRDDVDTLWYAWETLKEQLRQEGLDLRIRFIDRKGHEVYMTGRCYIPESGIVGDASDFAEFDLQLIGAGPLNINGMLNPIINPNVERLEWTATGTEPNKVQNNKLIGRSAAEILHVSLEGDDKFKVISEGEPTARQVRLDSAEGSLRFAIDFNADDFIYAIIIND